MSLSSQESLQADWFLEDGECTGNSLVTGREAADVPGVVSLELISTVFGESDSKLALNRLR